MTKQNRKIDALEEEGLDVIREGSSYWIQGGDRDSTHGFVKRFATIKAAYEQMIESAGRVKFESIGDLIAIIDLDYHPKSDPRRDGHVIAEASSLKDAKAFCAEFGYKEVEMTRSQFLNRVTDEK